MNRLGMVVDLSYVPEVTMEAALNVTRAPIIVSHALCNGSRSVSDNVLRLVVCFFEFLMAGRKLVAGRTQHRASRGVAEAEEWSRGSP